MNNALIDTISYDDLDLSVVMAVVADGVGWEDDSHMVECSELVGLSGAAVEGLVYYSFSPDAVAALAGAGRFDAEPIGWLEIAAIPLVEDLVAEVGEEWRPEAELIADQVLVARSARLDRLAEKAAAGPVGFSVAIEAAHLISASGFLTADLVQLI